MFQIREGWKFRDTVTDWAGYVVSFVPDIEMKGLVNMIDI
jgi:hypothetical protein